MELVTGHAGTLHITAKQVSRLLRGVTATDESTVQRLNVGNNAAITYSGITMSIASGELLLDGYHVTLVDDTGGASGETLIFDATLESTNSRIDKVILEIIQDNTTSYQRAEIVIVQGEESESPVAPATPTEPESSTEEFLAVGVIAQVTITGDDISSLSDLTNLYGGNYVEYTKFEDTISDLVNVYGAKNLIPYPYYRGSSYTTNGITFTVNVDGSITANGTATATAFYALFYNASSIDWLSTSTDYILSMELEGTGSASIFVSIASSDVVAIRNAELGYHEKNFTTPSSNAARGEVSLYISPGTTCSDLTIKPMLRMASIDDDTYEPYAMTNQELTKNVQDIENDISETQDIVSDAWSSSKIYAADEYCISGNKLYKCLVANTGTQPPNTTYWEETTCAEEISQLNSKLSYVGMIIHSTTLSTLSQVQAIYGANTTWIQHSGYMLRGATSGVVADSATKTGGNDGAWLMQHSHSVTYNNTGNGTLAAYGTGNGSWGSGNNLRGDTTVTINNAGSVASTNTTANIPNYKSVYIWERTA